MIARSADDLRVLPAHHPEINPTPKGPARPRTGPSRNKKAGRRQRRTARAHTSNLTFSLSPGFLAALPAVAEPARCRCVVTVWTLKVKRKNMLHTTSTTTEPTNATPHEAVSGFDSLGLIEPIRRAVHAENYTAPTPIQAQSIPHLLAGRDLLGCAQTGTGKTDRKSTRLNSSHRT